MYSDCVCVLTEQCRFRAADTGGMYGCEWVSMVLYMVNTFHLWWKIWRWIHLNIRITGFIFFCAIYYKGNDSTRENERQSRTKNYRNRSSRPTERLKYSHFFLPQSNFNEFWGFFSLPCPMKKKRHLYDMLTIVLVHFSIICRPLQHMTTITYFIWIVDSSIKCGSFWHKLVSYSFSEKEGTKKAASTLLQVGNSLLRWQQYSFGIPSLQ